MNTIIDRIFKNWKTTLVGLLIIVFTGLLIWFEKVSAEIGFTLMASALYFFYIKDANDKTPPQALGV